MTLKRAVILAAGRGTRVQPLTHDMPKPMIPLLGKPVMEYLIEHLASQGVREIMINVSHMADQIERHFGDGRRFGVQLGYSFEGYLKDGQLVPEPVGSAGALRKINDLGGFIDQTTAVLCGDAIVDVDLQAAAQRHREQGALATVVTREVPWAEVVNYGVVVSHEDGRVRSFQEKPLLEEARSRAASSGIYLVEPGVLDLIPEGQSYDIGSQLFPNLVQRGLPFFAQCLDFQWLDIGRVADYWQITQRLMQGAVPRFVMPGHQVRPGVWVGLNTQVDWESVASDGPVYVGSGASIGPGCRLVGPVWIGAGSHIGANSTIERSVLFDYTHVQAHTNVKEVIASGRYCVTKEGRPALANAVAAGQRWWGDARSRLSQGLAPTGAELASAAA